MKRLRIFSDVAQWGWRDWLVVAFGVIVLSVGSRMGRAWVAYR